MSGLAIGPLRRIAFGAGRFEPLGVALESLRIEIDAGGPPAPEPSMRDAWDACCRANPRLFNGAILSYAGLGPGGRISARRETYMRLLLRASRVHHLAVTGLLTAPGRDGRRCALLGQRSRDVGVHAGLWEFAPGGGLDCPPMGVAAIGAAEVCAQLAQEVGEELGLDVPAGAPGWAVLGLAIDHDIPSADIVVHVPLEGFADELIPVVGSDRWEYQRTCWTPLDELGGFDREHADGIIAPARCLIRALG